MDRPQDGPAVSVTPRELAHAVGDLLGPLEMRVMPTEYAASTVSEMVRVRVGATEFVDLAHDGSHWFAAPLRIDADGASPVDGRRRDGLGVTTSSPASAVIDAVVTAVRTWAAQVPPERRIGSAWAVPAVPTPPRTSRRRGVLIGVVGAVAAVALGATGAGLYSARGGVGGFVETGAQSVMDLHTGDCFDMTEGLDEQLQSVVDQKGCDEPHHFEVYAETSLEDAEFPGQDESDRLADDHCFESFEPFVGSSWQDSSLDYGFFSPSSESWSIGDRLVTCYLETAPDGETGSLAGSSR